MNDGLAEQRDTFSDLPGSDVDGPAITITVEQAMQACRGEVAELEMKLAEMRDLWMRAEAETATARDVAGQERTGRGTATQVMRRQADGSWRLAISNPPGIA